MANTADPPSGRGLPLPGDFDSRVAGIALLGEPIRRALYRYVVAQHSAVSRDEAASSVGVPRHAAKFHLDKLADEGLLDVIFRRPPGRGGPGAGRPAKLYCRPSSEVAISLPERRYDLAGHILAEAVTRSEQDGRPAGEALRDAAAATGRALGHRAREGAEDRESSTLAQTQDALAGWGYEPRPEDGCLTLENCPFHALAQDYTELVCGLNADFLQGFLEGLGAGGELEARLEPKPGRCCVVVHARDFGAHEAVE